MTHVVEGQVTPSSPSGDPKPVVERSLVLVTGAAGRLGARVVACLRARGIPVRALVGAAGERAALESLGAETVAGDLRDERTPRQACRDVARLVHCAEIRGDAHARRVEQRLVHVESTARLLRAAHDHGVARIVHVSTSATLGMNRDGRVLDETAVCDPRHLRDPYIGSKFEAEERARAAAWGGMPVVVVQPAVVLSPELAAAFAGARWAPRGGITVADVDDVAEGTLAALERGRPGERYVLGGHAVPWSELGATLARAQHRPAPATVVPRALVRLLARSGSGLARDPDVRRTAGWFAYVDSGRAARELGYRVRALDEIVQRVASEAYLVRSLVQS